MRRPAASRGVRGRRSNQGSKACSFNVLKLWHARRVTQRCVGPARSAANPCWLTARQPRLRGCPVTGATEFAKNRTANTSGGQAVQVRCCDVQRNAPPRWRDGGLRTGSERSSEREPQGLTLARHKAGACLGRPQPSGLLVQVQQVRRAAGGVVGCRLRLLVTSCSRGRRRGDEFVNARGHGNAHNDSRRSNDAGGSDENHAAACGVDARPKAC